MLFLDNDILISRESINHVIKLHHENEDFCLNPNWIYPASMDSKLAMTSFGRFMKNYNLVSFKGWYNHSSWRDNELFSSKSVASFHLSISKTNFVKSGGYNEIFAEAGFEDYDFPLRLKKINMRFFIDSRIVVFHNEEDRIAFDSWLIRQQRGAYTRKEAVKIGYKELAYNYSLFKKVVFLFARVLKPLILFTIRILSDKASFDALSFKLILLLQAQSIYQGYSHKESQNESFS
ncbi:MAG: hypothetical protein QM734_09480 [Cyclobacteriaceae bacterium]